MPPYFIMNRKYISDLWCLSNRVVIKPTYGANVDCGNGKTLARELVPEGIIMNVVGPSSKSTPKCTGVCLEQIKTRYAAETP